MKAFGQTSARSRHSGHTFKAVRISLLEEDGLLVIVSYLAAIPFLLYYAALVFLGYAGFARFMRFRIS
jgi:hypothetical protein